MQRAIRLIAMLGLLLFASASSPRAATMIYDGIVFSYPNYDYAPSVMLDGLETKIWWCANYPGYLGDVIGYRTAPLGGTWGTPAIALSGTPWLAPGMKYTRAIRMS